MKEALQVCPEATEVILLVKLVKEFKAKLESSRIV